MKTPEIITAADLAGLAQEATTSPRRRAHRNLHAVFDEPVQRLLIAAEPDTYVQPHRHPDKPWEMIVLLQGAMDVLIFSDDGVLEERVPLRCDGTPLIQYPAGSFHGSVVLAPETVVLEIKEGPYVQETAKETPAWAPTEDGPEGPAFRDRMRTMAPGDALT